MLTKETYYWLNLLNAVNTVPGIFSHNTFSASVDMHLVKRVIRSSRLDQTQKWYMKLHSKIFRRLVSNKVKQLIS